MSIVNLSDTKVSYQGEELAAINLIHKLQGELHSLAARLAAISEALGDLQASLLNSATLDVRVVLSREDLVRFRALGGQDDGERVRQAILSLINSGSGMAKPGLGNPILAPSGNDAERCGPSLREDEPLTRPLMAPEGVKPLSTRCPVCQVPIFLPESARDQLSLEVRCENCGAKSLLKTKV